MELDLLGQRLCCGVCIRRSAVPAYTRPGTAATAMGCLCTPDQLQQCWRNPLKKTRQLYSLYKKHEQRTGAGPNPHVLTPLVEAVLEVIGEDSPTLCGLDATIGDTGGQVTGFETRLCDDDSSRGIDPQPGLSGSGASAEVLHESLSQEVVQRALTNVPYSRHWCEEASQRFLLGTREAAAAGGSKSGGGVHRKGYASCHDNDRSSNCCRGVLPSVKKITRRTKNFNWTGNTVCRIANQIVKKQLGEE
ncbi:uncharacterized protein ISCGN_009098 [Ixodes scapularis]